jgi:hypothetical protein
MNFVFRMLFIFAVGLLTVSAAPTEERIWTGTNGRNFRGTFLRFEENNTKAVFFTASNQQVTVALDNLIPADRDRLIAPAVVQPPVLAPVVDAEAGFKKLPNANRILIPDVKPKDFGASDDEALVDAIWVGILWWEKAGILEVPGRGDFAKRAEWLHEQLSREISRGGRSSASLEDGKKGIEAYFKDELADTAVCRVKLLLKCPTVAEISATLIEARAIVMKMSMEYDNGRNFSIATTLESLTPEGKFVIHVFGTRLQGTVKTAADGKQEWVISNREAIPEYYQNQGARLFLSDVDWNGLIIMEPLVFATKGKPLPLPPEREIQAVPAAAPVR